jgi:hypothetical protein
LTGIRLAITVLFNIIILFASIITTPFSFLANATTTTIENISSLNNTLSAINNTLSALNQTQAQLNNSAAAIRGNLSNVTTAAAPTTNLTTPINATQVANQVFRDLPFSIVIMLFSIVIIISLPVVVDLVYAHRKGRRGIPGLYRALMTFGVIFIVGTIVVYLIALIAFNITIQSATVNALINILQNLGAILGTALASIIAFYFGIRGAESATEKSLSAAREREGGGRKPLEIISVSPIDGSEGEEITTAITATFSAPIRSSSITPDNFRVEEERTGSRIDGNIKLKDDNTTIEFKNQKPFNHDMKYWITIRGVTDLEGIAVTAEKKWYFKTK